jgi:ELWxxDGT repeat protein
VLFTATDAASGQELWVTDGTVAGTQLLRDINPGPDGSSPFELVVLPNGTAVFRAFDPDHGNELWSTDGTPAGTQLLSDIVPGVQGSVPGGLAALANGLVLFQLNAGAADLWVTDGTTAGTHMLADINGNGHFAWQFTLLPNGSVLFTVNTATLGNELWVTDGTSAGTMLLADLIPGSGSSTPLEITVLPSGLAVFSASDDAHGRELWVTDGSVAGTHLLKDTETYSNVEISVITEFDDGRAVFVARDIAHGNELWVTDGTAAGTTLLKDLNPGPGDSSYSVVKALSDGRVLFSAFTSGPDYELWVTDGTAAGTQELGSFNWSFSFSELPGGLVVFQGRTDSNGAELWVTDGTAAGTSLLVDINPGVAGSSPNSFAALGNGNLVFSAAAPTQGLELWITDGTAAGTQLLKDINATGSSDPQRFIALPNGSLLFVASASSNDGELWVTDGTPQGTVLVKDIYPGPSGSSPYGFVALPNGKVIFEASDPSAGREYWVSDGTAAGTMLLKDINPGIAGSTTGSMFSLVNGSALFGAFDAANGVELWVTDGTPAGTQLVKDIVSGNGSSFAGSVTSLDNGNAIFIAQSPSTGFEPWVTDGTAAGTFLLKDIQPGLNSSSPGNMIALAGGRALFTAMDADHGYELWVTDGTSAGTVLLMDVRPGASSSDPTAFQRLSDGRILFAANDGVSGHDLWITDGTAAGTHLVTDIPGIPYSGLPRELHLVAPLFSDHAPALAAPFDDQIVAAGGEFSLQVPTVAFRDLDSGVGDKLVYTATLVDGSPLPAWLTFDHATRTLSGIPSATDAGAIDIKITAIDLAGSSASDTFTMTVVANATLPGTSVAETFTGNDGDETLLGNGGDDTLFANGGNDLLDGGTGADAMHGGMGDDLYLVDHVDDTVTEAGDAGTDTVHSTVTYTLGANVENLVLLEGAFAIDAVGNGLDNAITGNSNANLLIGMGGNDTLAGGDGNDSYIVEDAGDAVLEAVGGGNDIVYAKVSYTLTAGSEIETLDLSTYASAANLNATGNEFANTLVGSLFDNRLDGGGGADVLEGGAGSDTYVVDNAGDVIIEAQGADVETVETFINDYVLGAAFDNLALRGTAYIGTGNSSANVLTGSDLDNVLVGGLGGDVLHGGDGGDLLFAGNFDYSDDNGNTLYGEDGDDQLYGGSFGDTLSGGDGNDYLYGKGGNDSMFGEDGDDLYDVEQAGDAVVEAVGAGHDTVQTDVDGYVLPDNVEDLFLQGGAALSASGNELDNYLRGNGANNSLFGLAGNDTLEGSGGSDFMSGGTGDDLYLVDDSTDSVWEANNEGVDTVRAQVNYALLAGQHIERLELTEAGAINATGNEFANTLVGNSFTNALDGGGGADVMEGGDGDDFYTVNVAGDLVTEAVNGGTDTVLASASYALTANVENLELVGIDGSSGTGNELANTLTGNLSGNVLDGGAGDDALYGHAGSDSLVGGSGADAMYGGEDSDTYSVDDLGDSVYEAFNEGEDTVETALSYVLGDNVEKLTLLGTSNVAGTGNALNNVLTGNDGNNALSGLDGEDYLDGGAGADLMLGGQGHDIYVVDNVGDSVFEAAGDGTDLVYTSVDFDLGDAGEIEYLQLLGAAFSGTGNALANSITGNAGQNLLVGLGGDDALDGNGGADSMFGGQGNDIYYVDNALDAALESPGQGNDTVYSTVSYVLAGGSEIETLQLNVAGNPDIDGTGNEFANTLIGTYGNNRLDGGAGADQLQGGAGSDIYVIDDIGDFIIETESADVETVESSIDYVLSTAFDNLVLTGAAINGTGNVLANELTGNSSNNVLVGSMGGDVLHGGDGGDILVGGNFDHTDSEGNTLYGDAGDDQLYGGSLGDTLAGGEGNDYLYGKGGNDSMFGEDGDDLYDVEQAGDFVSEGENAGHDTVQTDVDGYTLPANVEDLLLQGAAGLTGFGNELDNYLRGNGANNTLYGMQGNDLLDGSGSDDAMFGGEGDDTLVFGTSDTAVGGGTGTDTARFDAFASTLDLTVPHALASIERIDLQNRGNTLVIDATALRNLSETDSLLVDGGAADAVSAGFGWAYLGDSTIGAATYAEYVRTDGSQLLVNVDIDRSGIGENRAPLNFVPATQTVNEDAALFFNEGNGNSIAVGEPDGDAVIVTLTATQGLLALSNGANGTLIGGISGGDTTLIFGGSAGDVTDALEGLSFLPNPNYFGAASITVTATDGWLSSAEVIDVNVSPVNDAPQGTVLVVGAALEDAVLTVDTGLLSDVEGLGPFAYQWTRGGVDIVGATAPSHVLTDADVDAEVAVRVTYVDGQGTSEAVTSTSTVPVLNLNDAPGGSVQLSNVSSAARGLSAPLVGDVLWASESLSDDDGLGVVTLHWLRDGVDTTHIGSVYALGDADVGAHISVRAAYVDGHGQPEEVFSATSDPVTSLDIDLAGSLAGSGFRVFGTQAGDRAGGAVASAGDVNGDGYDDIIIGAESGDGPTNNRVDAGEVYVVFGNANGLPDIDLATMNAAQGFRVFGADAFDILGVSVNGIGDLNGDGFGDVVMGAFRGRASGNLKPDAGESYVLFGKAAGHTDVDLATLTSAQGFGLFGDTNDMAGRSVSSAGDVNSDGYDDVLIGADRAAGLGNALPNAGEVYVVFGTGNAGNNVDLATLTVSQGFRIYGADAQDFLGREVAAAGDINGDGYDEIIVGAFRGDAAGNAKPQAGEAYVLYGKASGFADLNLATFNSADGFRILGADAGDYAGRTIASAGDFNGDGLGDLIIGAYLADGAGNALADAGESYVVFGQTAGSGDIDLATLTLAQGLRIDGAAPGDMSGRSVAAAGDVNGDGYDDVIVGAFLADGAGDGKSAAGDAYVIFGKAQGIANIDLAHLAGKDGMRIFGADAGDYSGFAVSSAGDVNGDGFDDLLIGAYLADGAGNGRNEAGESYVLYGRDFTSGVVYAGTSDSDALIGTASAETFVGGQGDDILIGHGGADAFQGGAGNDVIDLGADMPLNVDGGSGVDTVVLDALGQNIVLTGANAARFSAMEKLDLTGTTVNTLTVTRQAALDMMGSNGNAFDDNTLVVTGDALDHLQLLDGWTQGAVLVNPLNEVGSFVTYTHGAARLLVESDVSVYTGVLDLAVMTVAQGFTILGEENGDIAGGAVSPAGDFNGDGIDDVMVGAQFGDGVNNSRNNSGEAYVIFGKTGAPVSVDLANLASGDGFKVYGANTVDFLSSNRALATAGDVNGDGIDDLLLGARHGDGPGNGRSEAGEAYLLFGKASGAADVDLATLTATQGIRVFGAQSLDGLGFAVASAGDINGDGLADMAIGAWGGDGANDLKAEAGEVYVVFGKTSGWSDLDLATFSPSQGMRVFGADPGDFAGSAVSSAGDFNGDGVADLIIGLEVGDSLSNSRATAGESYIIFGGTGSLPDLDLANLAPNRGLRVWGAEAYDTSGYAVASAGDFNGDGFSDIVIGAPNADGASNAKDRAGESYLLFGRASGASDIDLANLSSSDGIRISGAEAFDVSGIAVAAAGDVNGDGLDDLLIGAYRAEGIGNLKNDVGETYLIFGRVGGLSDIDLANLAPEQGLKIVGVDANDFSGYPVAAAGDINGDGYDDLLVGARAADGTANAKPDSGETYVIFGNDFLGQVTHPGTAADDALAGTAGADIMVGGRGNDVLIGNAGVDVYQGGAGDDSFSFDGIDRLVDGGSGQDTLQLAVTDMALDLDGLAGKALTNLEVIDLRGVGDNALSLSLLDVLNLSSTSNTLQVIGDAGDSVSTAPQGWVQDAGGPVTHGAHTYNPYTLGTAHLLIETHITQNVV